MRTFERDKRRTEDKVRFDKGMERERKESRSKGEDGKLAKPAEKCGLSLSVKHGPL